ncbi:hypothetical protein AMTR_s00086p00142850 [Amborella trichopoda]|uniref:Uncharacterized protein n=1 Tax=Amborella trichopoda TaxID=13333 RepID=W1P776_AMBTC|nr:hypothetical protein AMTR_s00086p00142850 [Amborella trichopoda]
MAARVTECPLSNSVKINMILEYVNLKYKTFFYHGGIPLTFNVMSDRFILYERTKSQTAGDLSPLVDQNQQRNQNGGGNRNPPNNQPIRPLIRFNPLKQPLSEILRQLLGEGDLVLPPQGPPLFDVKDKTKWYEWHRYHGHNPQDCISLKHHIQNLIEEGVIKVTKLKEPNNEANQRMETYVDMLPRNDPQSSTRLIATTSKIVSDSKGKTPVLAIHEQSGILDASTLIFPSNVPVIIKTKDPREVVPLEPFPLHQNAEPPHNKEFEEGTHSPAPDAEVIKVENDYTQVPREAVPQESLFRCQNVSAPPNEKSKVEVHSPTDDIGVINIEGGHPTQKIVQLEGAYGVSTHGSMKNPPTSLPMR